MAEQTITLEPGESKLVTFEVTPTVAKTYQVAVDGLAGSFKAIQADLELSNLIIYPVDIYPGAAFLIVVDVRNISATTISGAITCMVEKVGTFEKAVSLAPNEVQQVGFQIVAPQIGSYRVYIGNLEGLLVVKQPLGVTIKYTNPKRSSNTWVAVMYNPNTSSWPDFTMGVLIGGILEFMPTARPFLLRFQEATNHFFNAYRYGPFPVDVPAGSYTWNASAETLNGVKLVNLPTSNNRCRIKGRVIDAKEDPVWVGEEIVYYKSLTIILQEATTLSGYVNAGQYFINSTIAAETDEDVSQLVNTNIIAELKMVEIPAIDYKWEVSNIRIDTGYPPEAFSFSGSLWRVLDVPGYEYYSSSVHATARSNAGLSTFSVAIRLIDPNGWWTAFTTRHYVPGTEIREDGAGWYWYRQPAPGWPHGWKAELWAHPDPAQAFDYAGMPDEVSGADYYLALSILRGWVKIAG